MHIVKVFIQIFLLSLSQSLQIWQ